VGDIRGKPMPMMPTSHSILRPALVFQILSDRWRTVYQKYQAAASCPKGMGFADVDCNIGPSIMRAIDWKVLLAGSALITVSAATNAPANGLKPTCFAVERRLPKL